MSKYTIEIEDILNEYARNLHEYSNGVPGHDNDYREQTDQAIKAFKDLIVRELGHSLPEYRTDEYIEKEQRRLLNEKQMEADQCLHSAVGKAMGYNQAIDKIRETSLKRIKELR